MKIYAIIPSRYASSRLPGKPLLDIAGKPMIQRVYEGVRRCELLDDVIIATDDERIEKAAGEFGAPCIITDENHECGTDRITECVERLGLTDEDVVINVQGDEPLIDPKMINELIACFSDRGVYMATLAKRIDDAKAINDPNLVKVVFDRDNNALFFSRSPIPYDRDGKGVDHYKHIGIYGYKVASLKSFSRMEKSSLERAESLEQLRALENGFKIKVAETDCESVGIDTVDDLETVRQLLIQEGNKNDKGGDQ